MVVTQYSKDGVLASKDGISPYSSMLGVLPNVTHQAVLLASQVGGTFCLQKKAKKKAKEKEEEEERQQSILWRRKTTERIDFTSDDGDGT